MSGINGRILVSTPIAAHTFWCFGRQQRRQQSAASFGIVPPKASVCCYGDIQMTTLHPVPRHPPALPKTESLLCWARGRLFLSMTTTYAAIHRLTVPFPAYYSALGRYAGFLPCVQGCRAVLSVSAHGTFGSPYTRTVAIATIAHNILAIALATAMCECFGNHSDNSMYG
jgi:hypothetical protein